MNGSPSRCTEWPAPGSTARSAASRCSSTSQTASNGSLCAPETTSFGNGARAQRVERDLRRPRVALDHQRPRALEQRGETLAARRPARRPRRGSRAGTPRARAARSPRAASSAPRTRRRRVAARDRERRRLDHRQRAQRARVAARPRRARSRRRTNGRRGACPARGTVEPGRLVLEVDRSTSGPGGKPRRFGITSSNRSASGRCAAQVASPLTTLPWTRRTRGAARRHRRDGTKSAKSAGRRRSAVLQAAGDLWYSRPCRCRPPLRRRSEPAGAGGLLLAVLVVCIGVGRPRRLGRRLARHRRPDRRGRRDPRRDLRRLPALPGRDLSARDAVLDPAAEPSHLLPAARRRARHRCSRCPSSSSSV